MQTYQSATKENALACLLLATQSHGAPVARWQPSPKGPGRAPTARCCSALRHRLLSRGPRWPSRRGWPLWTRVPGKHTLYRHAGWVGMPAKGCGSAPFGSYDESPQVARTRLIALTRFDTKIGVALMNRANPAGFPGHYLSILATLFCLPSLFCQTGCRFVLVVPQSSQLVPQSAFPLCWPSGLIMAGAHVGRVVGVLAVGGGQSIGVGQSISQYHLLLSPSCSSFQ